MSTSSQTSKFTYGAPLRAGDLAGKLASLTVDKYQRRLVVDFGATVGWFAVPPDAALQLARHFRKQVSGVWGTLRYSTEDFPLRVLANRGNQMIESYLPEAANLVVANPEIFLAWADKFEEAVVALSGRHAATAG